MEKVGKSVFTIPLLLRIETKLEMCIDKDTSVSSNKNSKMFDSLCVCILKNFSPFEKLFGKLFLHHMLMFLSRKSCLVAQYAGITLLTNDIIIITREQRDNSPPTS